MAARMFSSNEAWPSENEVWVWQSISGHAGMATPLHLVNPLHCNGAAFNTPGTPELEIDWKGCAARGAASLALSKHVHQPPKAAKNDMFGG